MSDEYVKWRKKTRSRDLTGLGWLEAEILRIVWDKGEVKVRDVYEELRLRRRIAYTTVMSVLRNLHLKGLLDQEKAQAGYIYRPIVTDVDVAKGILDDVVQTIMGGRTQPLIEYLESYDGKH